MMLFLLPQQPPAVPTASVEGIVLRSGSGEPLARAQVKLIRVRTPEEERELYQDGEYVDPAANAPTALTEADGKFLLKDIPPGTYRITAARNGYAQQTLGQRVPDGPATVINLDPAQSVKNITFRLVQSGVITGRVRDSAGEPIAGVRVSLMEVRYTGNEDQKMLLQMDGATTDDRGEYRLYWVPPGRYYLGRLPGARTLSTRRTFPTARWLRPFTPEP